MLATYTNLNAISTNQDYSTASAALHAAGTLLERGGFSNPTYTDAILDNYQHNGAYFVIAPGIALPHARPIGVLKSGISILTLKTPLDFGNTANGPADLIVALAATGNNDHLALLSQLVTTLSDRWRYQQLVAAESAAALYQLLE